MAGIIGRYTPSATGSVHDMTVIDHGGSVGRRAYLAYGVDPGVMILNAAHVTPGVIQPGSPNQALNPEDSINPPRFIPHHAFPTADGTRLFIEDELFADPGDEPVQMWDISDPANPSYVDGIAVGSALMPVVNFAHNLEVRYDLDLDGDGSPDDRLYVGWYKAGLRAFDFNSSGFITRRMDHQVQTEQQDDEYDGAWGVRLATIGTYTYIFQSDRRYGLIIDKVDICSALANPGEPDTDGDGVVDLCDPDDDNDSLGLGDPFGLFFRDEVELFLGTLALVACAGTPDIDDEDPDATGTDWDDSQDVDGSDVFLFAQRFGAELGEPPPLPPKLPYIPRFDIYPTAASLGKIDGSDVFVLANYFRTNCP